LSALTADRLAGAAEDAHELIAELDPARPADRRLALDAAEGLVDRWIAPAAHWFTPDDEEPEFVRLDPSVFADEEFHGMMLSFLGRDITALREPPEDDVLAAALDDREIPISSPDRRAAFFATWMAQRALYIVRDLIRVVRDDPGLAPGEAAWELDRLRGLRDGPLPTLDREVIEHIVEERSG
jgi:hypothetical protein